MKRAVIARVALIALSTGTATGCVDPEAIAPDPATSATEALSVAEVAYYCSTVWPSHGWTFGWGGANACTGSAGGAVKAAGLYSTGGVNTVEARCAPNYYWIYVGTGADPLGWAYNAAATTPTQGDCTFTVTMGATPRRDPAPPSVGCAGGVASQRFGTFTDAAGQIHSLVGCAGRVAWTARASLCAASWTPAPAADWAAISKTAAPTHDYWTNDTLGWGTTGGSGQCKVSTTIGGDVASCGGGGGGMHVCTPTGTDAEGNTCTWTGCGLDSTTNAFFGGCASSTAGTICERIAPPPAYAGGCADGSVEQTFGTYTDAAGAVRRMVGCAGATTWDQRGGLCAPGWSPASADDWRIARAGQAPTHDYWTNDHLGYTGSGSGTCAAAVGSSALACPTNQPMRVCVGTAADPEGNTCTWAGCGLGTTTPSLSLGGCYSNPTAGSLCQQRVTTPVTPTVPRYAFDRAAFGASVHRALTAANPKGFQFALLDDTGASVILDRGGTATGDGTSLYVPMTDDRRIDSASMSKTITATAVVAALEDLEARGVDVSLDTAIRAYLPSNWAIPTWAYNLTFRDVLLHTSGFGDGACTSNRYEDVRTMVEHVAPTCTVGQQRCYTNCNYALLRVALAYLVDGPLAYRPFESDAAKTGAITALSYRNFIRGRVLAPIGLGAVDEYFTGTTPDTMYFHLDHSNCPMPDPDNNILTAGPGTWTLSATEYAQFLTALRRGRIVSPTAYQAMQATIVASDSSDAIGMWRHDGKLGRYYDHSGGGGYALGGWCGPVADWMIFANGYTGVYITNTANAAAPNELNFETLKSNFDAAITLLP